MSEDIFSLLEAELKPAMEKAEKEKRAKELARLANSPKSSHKQRVAAKQELQEVLPELEAAKWRPIAALFVQEHTTCKHCNAHYTHPVGFFIKRETIAAPKSISRKRVMLETLIAQHSNLPCEYTTLAKQVERCMGCVSRVGWAVPDMAVHEVILFNNDERIVMSAQDFFGE